MPTISVWVSEDVKKLWDRLNEFDHLATKELRKAVVQIIERYKDKLVENSNSAEIDNILRNLVEQLKMEREFLNAVASVKQEDVVLELYDI